MQTVRINPACKYQPTLELTIRHGVALTRKLPIYPFIYRTIIALSRGIMIKFSMRF
jgi:hypothetical protein